MCLAPSKCRCVEIIVPLRLRRLVMTFVSCRAIPSPALCPLRPIPSGMWFFPFFFSGKYDLPLLVWARGVGGLLLRWYSLYVRADSLSRPSAAFKRRPARTSINADVAHAECDIFFANYLHISKFFCNFAAQNRFAVRSKTLNGMT